MGWIWAGYGLAMGCIWADYGLAIGWLWPGYWLAMAQNQYTSRQSILPKLHIAASNTLDYSEFMTILSGYWLAIGWLLAGYGSKSLNIKA